MLQQTKKIIKINNNEVIINNNEKYITFDTVKIKCDHKYIKHKYVVFNNYFSPKTGELNSEKYCSKNDPNIPYNIFIDINYYRKTLTLEFSSKILLNAYPNLISKYTIHQCLVNINKLGICELDVDSIILNGCFTKLDVTTDKVFNLNESVLNKLNSVVQNYRRYKWSHYTGEGITFTKDVKSKDCSETITLYNKSKELVNKVNNMRFLNQLTNKNEVIDYFSDKTRLEITLSTQDKIKSYLDISDTKIMTVLNSTANPILSQFERVFGDSTISKMEYKFSEFEEYAMSAIIVINNKDMKLVEQIIRKQYNSRSGYGERMKKLDAIYNIMLQQEASPDTTIQQIKTLLN